MTIATQRSLRALPKAHLHLHLEAAMRPATLAELSERYGVPRPEAPDGTFTTFLRMYGAAVEALRSPDDYVRLVYEMAEDAAADGAVWVEPSNWITLNQARRLGFTHIEAVLEVFLDAIYRAQRDVGIGIGLMVACNRQRPISEAVELAQLAAKYAGRGVVSFGIAGDETLGAAETYAEAFATARAAGLLSTPHAGEHGGPESVRAALDALGARRIQHGVRSIEDPRLVERLVAEGVCLDVCPTSNVHLQVVPTLSEHPLSALLAAGVAVSLNADDPLIFGCGVLDEYELARRELGLDDAQLATIAASSVRACGAPEGLRASALAEIAAWKTHTPGL